MLPQWLDLAFAVRERVEAVVNGAKLIIGARRDAELARLVAEMSPMTGVLSLRRGTFAQKLTQRTIAAFPSATPVRDPGTADPRRLLVICAPQHTGGVVRCSTGSKPVT
jgi:hypothetical protein